MQRVTLQPQLQYSSGSNWQYNRLIRVRYRCKGPADVGRRCWVFELGWEELGVCFVIKYRKDDDVVADSAYALLSAASKAVTQAALFDLTVW